MNLKEFLTKVKPIKLSVTKDPIELEYKSQLLCETEFLNVFDKVPLSLRYFCVQNDITEIPRCEHCYNKTTYNSAYTNKGFNRFCSEDCRKKYKVEKNDFNKFLKDKEWLYEQRITLKKSKELIAEELNCSIIPVNKWIKIHNIPEVKYNKSNSLSLLKLEDKDWLYEQHVINRRKCSDIGDELGVSKSTISVYLSKHEIQANEPNSYDREIDPSDECLEIYDFIKEFYPNEVYLDKRGIIGSFELDIYIPDKNFAIEYNGVYSHHYRPHETTFAKRKDKEYHLNKTVECEKLNIDLLHIFSGNWKSNKEVWKSVIKNKLGYTENKIYARNCEIRHVSVHEKNIFLDENHIQGNSGSNVRLGLYFNDMLVSLITFDVPRYNKKYDWEIIRFCNKNNYCVVGGFSKLLSYFRKNYSGSIITYANRTYSSGNLYRKNGFKFIKMNKPSYWYVDLNTEILQHKTNFKKKKLLEKLNEPSWSEEMLAFELGYKKVFDCGQLVFVME